MLDQARLETLFGWMKFPAFSASSGVSMGEISFSITFYDEMTGTYVVRETLAISSQEVKELSAPSTKLLLLETPSLDETTASG
jgi:hypothetical protein